MKQAHRKDGAAMVRFEIELRRRLAAGESWMEMEASDYLLGLRRAQEENLGASFETIAAYGPNAAMMHYAPTPQACAAIEPHGFLLVDSGGQYRDGTTDITRTYALGALTEEEREDYTLVLKCHIAAARAVFKEGSADQPKAHQREHNDKQRPIQRRAGRPLFCQRVQRFCLWRHSASPLSNRLFSGKIDMHAPQHHARQRHEAEHIDNFHFVPAAQLEMVVDRAHFENALAMRQLEIGHLQHHAARFSQIYHTEKDEQLWPAQAICRGYHGAI